MAPNPELELDRLRKQLAQGLPRVLLLVGPSRFFRGEALDLAVAAVPPGSEVRVLDGAQETDGNELQDLRGSGLFTTGRVLAVRRADEWLQEHSERLLAVLPKIGSQHALVLELTKMDARFKLSKELAAAGARFEFRELYATAFGRDDDLLGGELVSWVVKRGSELGLELAKDAALLLVGTTGKDPAELLAELRRLALRLRGRRGPIRADTLRGELAVGFRSDQFEFARALLARNRAAAERSLHGMFEHGLQGRESATESSGLLAMTVHWLFRELTSLWRARRLVDEGLPLRELAATLRVPPQGVDRLQQQVRVWSRPALRRALLALHELQREMRRSSEDEHALLSQLVASLCAREATA